MADALVSPAVAVTMYAATGAAAAYSIKKLEDEDIPKKVAKMGVMGSFVFAAQMINFTIPGTGSSGHLCGGMLLAAVLGPYAGFLTMIGVLLTQALLFGDGGLLALGANVWNMAFYGCFVGYLIIWKPMMSHGMSRKKIVTASVLGAILTLQLGALSVTLETLASNVTELPFGVFLAAMQPIHLAIGAVEGLITAAVLSYIYSARPEMLSMEAVQPAIKKVRLSESFVTAVLTIAAFVIGGIGAHFASGNPDGLEWSMEKVAGTSELSASGMIHSAAEKIQEFFAVLPDYAFANSDSPLGTTVSGIVGILIILALAAAISFAAKKLSANKK